MTISAPPPLDSSSPYTSTGCSISNRESTIGKLPKIDIRAYVRAYNGAPIYPILLSIKVR